MVSMKKREIDRLGLSIGNSSEVSSDDLELLQAYRLSFHEPLARVFSFVLSSARKLDRQSIVTYRIKRIDTIIEKLRRFTGNNNGRMLLSRMGDIAGCRCILSTVDSEKMYQLQEIILNEYGDGCKINDYVANPKNSGYRSIHIYVKDKQCQVPIEIQIRNYAQHNWATLVEIVDVLYETKNKEQGLDGPLGPFLSLFSRASELDEDDFSRMLKMERRQKVFERMSKALTSNYLNIRRQWLTQNRRGCYYVITANKKKSEIVTFPTFKEAELCYYEKYLANTDSNIVLTHIENADFEHVSMAYSNYVLAMHTFFDDYRAILADRIINCLKQERYRCFFRYFKVYNSDVRGHIGNLSKEIRSIESCYNDSTLSRNQINNWVKEINARINLWRVETNDFFKRLSYVSYGNRFKRWLISNRVERLRKAVSRGWRDA